MSRTIHVTCGDSVAGGLNAGLRIARNDVVSLYDCLDCGPLGAFRDLSSWRAMRAAFWEGLSEEPGIPTKRRRNPRRRAERDPLDRPERLAEASEVVLWLGTGLMDQLTLPWMPQLFRVLGIGIERLRVVQFERSAAGWALTSLGILPLDEYRAHPAPRALDEAELAHLEDAWNAVISPDPDVLLRFLDRTAGPLPLLSAALKRILWRYPDALSGVNRYEARLLANTRGHGPAVASVIGRSMMDVDHEDDHIGDLWLFWRLKRLADPTLPHPAVSMTGKRTTMGGTEVRLTPIGERIADGEANFVALNGIEDWVGGVHLDSQHGDVWFRRDDTLESLNEAPAGP